MLRNLILCLLALSALIGGEGDAQTPKAPSGFTVSNQPLSLSVAGLHVSGNLILNGQGQAVQLHGVNQAGAEYMCINGSQVFDGPTDAASIAAKKAWGINSIRLLFNEDCWLGINGLPGGSMTATQYQTGLVNYVNALTANNIAVILSLYYTAPGTTPSTAWCNNQFPPMPDADHAPTAWASVMNVFKTNSSVIPDVYNEPYPDNNQDSNTAWDVWQNGGTIAPSNCPFSYNAASMQSLVSAIRGTGATNIIMVPGIGFSFYLDQWVARKPTDTSNSIAVSFHYYPQQVYDAPYIDNLLGAIMQSYPLIQGELGENDCQHVNIDPWMVYHDAHGGSYLGWAWNTYDCSSFPGLISNYDGTPTSFGIGFRDHLLMLSGRPIPTPPVIPFFNGGVFPYGLAIGRGTSYTASDGTVYYPDTASSTLTQDVQFFTPYTTGNSISNTNDPTLYQTGRVGAGMTQTLNVPNGNYTVTLGMAPTTTFTQSVVNDPSTASVNNEGEFGQDQTLQDTIPTGGQCVWSPFSGTNNTPYTSPTLACPGNSTTVPTTNAAATVSYNVSVFNQHLKIQVGASFGGGRKTILNSVKVVQQSVLSLPSIPTGLFATGANLLVNLSWTATSGATTYNIFRANTARGFYRQIAIAATNAYADAAVVNGKTYYYLIQAANATGASAKTASVNATPGVVAPSAPTGVSATPGNAQVSLSWAATNTATSYHVKRSITSGSGYGQVGAPTSNSFTDTGRTNGTTYYYVVTALNAAGESGNSSEVSATPNAGGGTGVWTNVTPAGINLTPGFGSCNSFGIETVYGDTSNPGNMYMFAHCQGLWKSTDYGQSWTGPINTGTSSSATTDCAGGISLQPNASAGGVPTVYLSCIRGSGLGFWKSVDGGVNWTNYTVPPGPSGFQDWYPAVIDPYTPSHLIMAGHEQNYIIQSSDGGHTWASVSMNAGMAETGGTAFLNFVDTGNASTTAQTWLWTAQESGGTYGTWRTANSGSTWTKVDNAEHAHGALQIYQAGGGVIFMGNTYSASGNGVLRSTDYGVTWSHVGLSDNARNVVWASATKIYSTYGWPAGNFNIADHLEVASQPGTGTWTAPGGAICTSPGGLSQGPSKVAVVNDGVHYIFVSATFNAGLCRYIEP
jgi:hypothetical protein